MILSFTPVRKLPAPGDVLMIAYDPANSGDAVLLGRVGRSLAMGVIFLLAICATVLYLGIQMIHHWPGAAESD